MNHEPNDIEQLLLRQMLRKPPAGLDKRVAGECRPAAPAALKVSRWLAAAAACMLVAAAVWPLIEEAVREAPSEEPPLIASMIPHLRPGATEPDVVIEHTWSQVTPGSVVHDADAQPYRPYYVQSIHQASWTEEDGSEVTLTYPETDIYYASLPVY